MAAKIKLHNPELAKNSKFSNLVIESLSSDPVLDLASVGRLWFDNTNKVFKGSFLNADNTAAVAQQIGVNNTADVQANTDAINQEITDRTNADTTITNNIGDLQLLTTTSKTDLVSAVNENQTNLAQEITDRTNADTTITNNIGDLQLLTTTSKTDLVSAVNENQTNLAQEITDRTNADSTLQTNIDTLSNDVNTNYLNKTTTTAQSVAADTTFSGTVVVQGDFTVSGTTTTVDTEQLKVSDNVITLNSDVLATTDPTENAGIEVNRGTAGTSTIIQWNETNDVVEVQSGGTMVQVATINDINNGSGTIQTELDNTQAGAGLGTDGSYTADGTTNYIAAATDLMNADKLLDTQIKATTDDLATEVTNRTDADNALDTRITNVENQVSGNIGDLTTLTTDAKDTLVNAINEVDSHVDQNSTDLATEITNRNTAVSNLQTELDNTQAGAGLGTDGSYTADGTTNYIAAATSLFDADKKLDTQIKTNADDVSSLGTRVTNLETQSDGKIGDLSTLTTDAKDTLVNAINEVDSHIDTEVTNRTTADTNLQTNIDTEVTDRTNADNALGTRIDNVNTAAGIASDTYTADGTTNYIAAATSLFDADKKLDSQIKTTVDDYVATTANKGTNLVGYEGYTESNTNIVNPTIEIAAGTLKASLDDIASSVNTRINDIENRYVKGEVADADKSDTYTIAHNLDTNFVDVSVQVYDAVDLVWRFDLVVIEVIDANTVKISLSSGDAEQIRYVIQGY